MSTIDVRFANLLSSIVGFGDEIDTRNSITRRRTAIQMDFFSTPLVSVRKTAWKNALREMEWFLSGSTCLDNLDPRVHHWWKPWADEDGYIDNNYSAQFRRFYGRGGPVDQIKLLTEGTRDHPYSRRNVITTWNTADMVAPSTPITNCHGTVIQTFCDPQGGLELFMYQRSCDMLLGVPHNWIQYWAFLLWLCAQTGKTPKAFKWVGGDCHVYKDHFDLVAEVQAAVRTHHIQTPELVYTGAVGDPFRAEDFRLEGEYKPIITKTAKMVV